MASSWLEWAVMGVVKLIYMLKLESWVLNVNVKRLANSYTETTKLTGGLVGIVQQAKLDIVIKTSDNTSVLGRQQCKLLQTWREAKFHENHHTIFPAGDDITLQFLPKVYHTEYNPMLGDFCIVMERIEGDILKNQLGAQGTISEYANPLPLLTNLYTELAKFHASKWKPSRDFLVNNSWLQGVAWSEHGGQQAYEDKVGFARMNFLSGKQTRAHLLSPKLLRRLEYALVQDKDNFQKMCNHMESRPICLNHGDFHASNVILCANTGRFVFLDLSEVGVFDPTYDLAQLLLSDLEGKHYSTMLKPLVQAWHAKLRELCLEWHAKEKWDNDYTWECAYRDMLLAGMNKWVYMLGILLGFSAVGDDRIQYWATNLEAWMEEITKEFGRDDDHVLEMRGFLKV